jgi:20S proteasome alpha/beta subunit
LHSNMMQYCIRDDTRRLLSSSSLSSSPRRGQQPSCCCGRATRFLLAVSILVAIHGRHLVVFGSSSNNPSRVVDKDIIIQLSPIDGWQASWTASQAQGTAMAMVVQDDCLVVVCRSPRTNVYKYSLLPLLLEEETRSTPDDDDDTWMDGLRLQKVISTVGGTSSTSSTSIPMVQYAPSWFPLTGNACCAMTGLAMDVEHLCRVLQKLADDHYNVYQSSSSSTPHHTLVVTMAQLLQSACRMKESRPYGAQILLVGCNDNNNNGNNNNNAASCSPPSSCPSLFFGLYTIDPSGTWQSWGKATAIGKYARQVRMLLGSKLRRPKRQQQEDCSSTTSNNNNNNSNVMMTVSQGVELLLQCWIQACQQEQQTTSTTATATIASQKDEDWDVYILRKGKKKNSSSEMEMWKVPTEDISQLLEKTIILLSSTTNNDKDAATAAAAPL